MRSHPAQRTLVRAERPASFMAQLTVIGPDEGSGSSASSADDSECSSDSVVDAEQADLVSFAAGSASEVACVCFSASGRKLASGDAAGVLRLWHCERRVALRRFGGHRASIVWCLYRKKRIVSGAHDATIRIWSDRSSVALHVICAHADVVTSGCFADADCKQIVSSSNDGTVKVWSVRTAAKLFELEAHTAEVARCLAFQHASFGAVVVSVGWDRIGFVSSVHSGRLQHRLIGHTSAVVNVCVDSSGASIATCSLDGSVRVWSSITGICLHLLLGHPAEVSAAAFTHEGGVLLSTDAEGFVCKWQLESGSIISIDRLHRGAVVTVSPSSCDLKSLTIGEDRCICWFDAHTRELSSWNVDCRPSAACVLGSGWLIALGDAAGRVHLFRERSGLCVKRCPPPCESTRSKWRKQEKRIRGTMPSWARGVLKIIFEAYGISKQNPHRKNVGHKSSTLSAIDSGGRSLQLSDAVKLRFSRLLKLASNDRRLLARHLQRMWDNPAVEKTILRHLCVLYTKDVRSLWSLRETCVRWRQRLPQMVRQAAPQPELIASAAECLSMLVKCTRLEVLDLSFMPVQTAVQVRIGERSRLSCNPLHD
jgi:WD40 repeat protein